MPAAAASVQIDAPAEAYTGAPVLVSAAASAPGEVVLYEWDFDGDGAWDANATNSTQAQYAYATADNYTIRVRVTRDINGSLTSETNGRPIVVRPGQPEVSIDLPDRPVASVVQVFRAAATDPDPARGGEPFTYVWAVDGVIIASSQSEARIMVDHAGPHVVSVEVTDSEGLTARREVTVDFAPPGLFEGKSGMVNFAAAVTLASFGLALVMARMQRRERRAAALKRDEGVLQSSEEAVPGRRTKPAKVPFAGAAPTQAEGAGARISLGGTPSALERTKECPVCHNAIDEALDYTDCPFCKANDEAQRVESKLAETQYDSLDLSEVKALLARARRDRHLGRLDDHRKALAEADELLETLAKDREEATLWVEKVRDALAQTRRAGGKADRLERAESYFTLADSLHRAHQHGKAARHARRAFEIMSGADEEEEPESDYCPSCKKPVAGAIASGAKQCPHCGADLGTRGAGEMAQTASLEAERAVRDLIAKIREQLKSGTVERDEEAQHLLESAEHYERAAQWGQALEVLTALKERFDRERAAAGPPEAGEDPPTGPSDGPT